MNNKTPQDVTLAEAFLKRLDGAAENGETLVIAVDGGSGSGKTTFAERLSGRYDCNVFHADDFFLQRHMITPERLCEVGGNIDYERLKDEVLRNIKSGKSFSYRPYSCRAEALKEPVIARPKRINIVEGVYSLHPTLSCFYDIKIFLSADKGTCLKRILKRGGAELFERYVNEWLPLEDRYFQELGIQSLCDFILSDGFEF